MIPTHVYIYINIRRPNFVFIYVYTVLASCTLLGYPGTKIIVHKVTKKKKKKGNYLKRAVKLINFSWLREKYRETHLLCSIPPCVLRDRFVRYRVRP